MYLNVIFELSDNLNELYIELIQFSLSIGKKSKMYVLYKKQEYSLLSNKNKG